jgi:hypothetical protein
MRALLLVMVAGVMLSACLQLWSWTLHAKGMELKDRTSPAAQAYRINLKNRDLSTYSTFSFREQYRMQLRRSTLKDRPTSGVIAAAVTANSPTPPQQLGADAVSALGAHARIDSRARIGSAPSPQQHASSEPMPPEPAAPPRNHGIAKHQQQLEQDEQQSRQTELLHHEQQQQRQQQQQHNSDGASILGGTQPVVEQRTGAPVLVATTHSIAAAGGGTTSTTRASVLQLARAYEESLSGLSMALQMTQQKATETAALRDLLGRALQQQEKQQAGADSSDDSSGSDSSAAQRQLINITAIAAGTAAVVKAADGGVAQAAGTDARAASSRSSAAAATTTAGLACDRGTGQRIRLFIGVYVSKSTCDSVTCSAGQAHQCLLQASATCCPQLTHVHDLQLSSSAAQHHAMQHICEARRQSQYRCPAMPCVDC